MTVITLASSSSHMCCVYNCSLTLAVLLLNTSATLNLCKFCLVSQQPSQVLGRMGGMETGIQILESATSLIEMFHVRWIIAASLSNGAHTQDVLYNDTTWKWICMAVEDTLRPRAASPSMLVYLQTLKLRFSKQRSTQRSITHELQIWFSTSISLAEHFPE